MGADADTGAALLSVRDLRTHFETGDGRVRAVDGVSFDVAPGETVCIVGESGSGKTVACESVTKLLPMPPAEIDGEIRFDGRNLVECSTSAIRAYRGGRIGHVFQNPQDVLDPVYTVGDQVVEAIRLHRDVARREARERAKALLSRVGIGNVDDRFADYPHQFSGGMKQRVVVAIALACDPDLLIADEPTTALDVTIQAQVLRLLEALQSERGMGILFVTHDLGVVAQIADRVVVMYAGKVMERGPVERVFAEPAHPYTRALLDCLPGRGRAFDTIDGTLPDPTDVPDGCRFHPRCPHVEPECRDGDQPNFVEVGTGDGTRDDAGDGGGDATADGPGDGGGDDHAVSCVLHGTEYELPAALGGRRD